MRTKDKVAVITGGASGLGKRIVERFVEAGGRAVVADVQDAAGLRMCEDLGNPFGSPIKASRVSPTSSLLSGWSKARGAALI